jgi:hypothetical protein
MTRYASALIEDLRVQFLTQHPACLNRRGCSVRPAFRQIARAVGLKDIGAYQQLSGAY